MPCPRPPNDHDAALRQLCALLEGQTEPATVTVQAGHLFATVSIPPPPPPPAPSPRDDDERDCRQDILAVLRDAVRRLTTTQILAELARREWFYGDRTVQNHLAAMVADGTLDNDPQGRPRGYGIALR